MKRTQKFAVAAGLAALLCTVGLASGAVATPESPGLTRTPPVTGTLDGTSSGPHKVSQDKVELKTKTETSVTTFELTYPPGSFSGWHAHPGIVIVVVKSGTVIRQTGCGEGEEFTVNEAFTEVGPHYVSNEGDVDAVLSITRIYPKSATAGRIDLPAPVCP
ncbi:hypothetical protein [Mycetocola sp. 2940]|uniref:cupin domain-containing protein n=1 Tax=Mycetocola sp. 2940 TaxID=3156452 RepID=UPI003395E5E6